MLERCRAESAFPLFMLAAELATLLSCRDQTVEDLRWLEQLFPDDYVHQAQFERGVVDAITELFDLNHVNNEKAHKSQVSIISLVRIEWGNYNEFNTCHIV